MNILRYKHTLFYTLIIVLTSLSSCSYFEKNSIVNEGTKQAVAQVVEQYLRFSFLARMPAVESTISLGDFLQNQQITYDEFDFRIVRLSSHWSNETNPLIQLKIISIILDEDDAKVILQREGSSFPELHFQLKWVGSSWAVLDDNIFGKNELYEKGQ